MPCKIKNPANYDLGDLESHVHGMYDHFDQKYGFQKPPVMVFDSDPSNQSKVLGKTAYYDPQSLEIHVFIDGRHPKDVLRSIAHELIHHRQNMEGRLDTGGYSGPGYYLENDELKEVEHEAMLEGNATMREYEDTVKYKNIEENKNMSLKEWKNNELNKQLLKKFGILKENKKPDFPDVDGDGDREEPISKAQKDKKAKGGDEKKASKPKKGEVPPQLQKHVKGKKDDKEEVDESFKIDKKGGVADEMAAKYAKEAEKNKKSGKDKPVKQDKESGMYFGEEKEEMEEGRNNPRTTNADKFAGHEDRYQSDRIHEGEEEEDVKDKDSENKKYNFNKKGDDAKEKENTLEESIKKIAKAKRVFLNGKRVK